MGACYSSSEQNKIKATTYVRQKKSTGCLSTICCDSEKNNEPIRPQNQIMNNPNIRSSYNINYEKGPINDHIDTIISNDQSPIPLQKLNYVQLYNIFMNFTYDFTKSDFIVCDTRKNADDKTQIFIKKFYQINYSPPQIESMQQNRLDKIKNYLNNKKIIFILKDEDTFEILEQFITIFSIHNDFNINKIFVLSETIQKYEERQLNNTYLENLNLFIDEDSLYEFTPKILINSSDIKSSILNYDNDNIHNAFAFVITYPHLVNSKNKINMNKLDINNICDKDVAEENIYLKFFAKFKIKCILNFILEEKKENENNNNLGLITHSEAKRKKIADEEHKVLIKQINISIPNDMADFNEFYDLIQNDFDTIIEDFKSQIVNNNCIIFEFDDAIEEVIKIKLLFIIVNKITGLCFEDIENYLKNNFFIVNQENILINKEEIDNFLK